eukprot:TRINITY_DN18371_c0_g1_i1.p1 TRINITY_DN18371_c0_g1~~TRINITY_DN18371_c0_g1_i1.p1  ORF type:complete len:1029 (+),score=266.97 TRINITY_DN18371_c0_g1_i1:173-3259(+)
MAADKAELGSQDTKVQGALRRWGNIVGANPCKTALGAHVVFLTIVFAGWLPRLIDPDAVLVDRSDGSLQWTVSGGKLEKKLRNWLDKHGLTHDWQKPVSVTMYLGKGKYKDKDILTREVLEEYYQAMRAYSQLNTTVQGANGPLEYNIYDVCDRGVLPDVPGSLLVLPCLDIGPMHCFKEQLDMLHPSYQAVDPWIKTIKPFKPLYPEPYSTRPSFRSMTDDQIKQTLSTKFDPAEPDGRVSETRGCFFWTTTARFPVRLFSGMTTWKDDGNVSEMRGFRTNKFLDAAPRIQYRLSLLKPTHAREQDVREAMKGISNAWMSTVQAFNAKSEFLEIVNLEDYDYYVDERMKEASQKFHWEYFIPGVVALNLFCLFVTFSTKHPLASRAAIALNGLGVIGSTTLTSGGLFLLLGLDFNPVILLATPLLAFGIGADDMFVIIRYFSGLGYDFISTHTPEEVTGEVLARAGPGVLLSSVCNAIAFGVGAFFPIYAMRLFCLSCFFVAVIDFLMMNTLFAVYIREEARRIRDHRPEPNCFYCCQKKRMESSSNMSMTAVNSIEQDRSCETKIIKSVQGSYARFVSGAVGRWSITIFGVLLMALSAFLVTQKEYGYSPHELFASDDPINRGVELYFGEFSSFPANLVFDNLDVAAHQEEMIDLYMELLKTNYIIDGGEMPWLKSWHDMYFYGVLLSTAPAAVAPTLQFLGYPNAPSCVMNSSYKYGKYLPAGPFIPDDKVKFYQALQKDRTLPEPIQAFTSQQQFLVLDGAGINEFTFEQRNSTATGAYEELTLSFFPLTIMDLQSEGKFVDAIAEYQAVIDKSPLKDHVFLNSVLVFWETFVELEYYLWALVAISVAGILVVTLLIFSCDLTTAVITSLACCMIFVEIYGISVALMRFNIFVAALSLFGLGMSVEFTAHLAASFSLHKEGTPTDRLGLAMAQSFPALLEGSITTIVCAAPMAFFPTLFVVKYLFGILVLVVVIGMLNGCLILPGMLAALASITQQGASKEAGGISPQTNEIEIEPVEEESVHI